MAKCRGMDEDSWESYSQWQRTLVAKSRRKDQTPAAVRATDQQRLLAATLDSASALALLLRKALVCDDGRSLEIPPLKSRLTAEHARTPSAAWEKMLHESLAAPVGAAAATRAEAAQVLFWVVCSVGWLESGGFDDPPAQMLTKEPFAPLLQFDPAELNDEQRLVIDKAARDVLRGLGGIPHVRSGHNNHLLDCATARAWWRVEIARQAESNSDGELSFDDCYEALLPPGCWRSWTTTAMTMAGRLSAGSCAAAFASAVRAHQARHGVWPDGAQAGQFAFNMVRRSAGFYPGMLDYRTLLELAH